MESACLPSDWVEKILVKLPVKSIIRFECVAKTWYHLFRTSSFVSQHHSVSSKNNKLSLLRYHRPDTDSCVMSTLDMEDQTVVDLYQPLSNMDSSFSRICVDNGLVCIHNRQPSRITIWNPATREFRILPQFGDIIPGDTFNHVAAFGFAMDPLSNDYKVIYIRRCRKGISITAAKWIAEYAVYHMSTDSWRVLKKEDDKFVYLTSQYWSKNTCVNGVLYFIVWIAGQYNESGLTKNQILAFDLDTEAFRFIQSPMPYDTPYWQKRVIRLRDNHLGFWNANSFEPSYGLWILNDDQESWTNLRNIELGSDIRALYGIWNNGEMFVKSLSEKVLIYDVETDEFIKTRIKIKIGQWELCNIYPYEETIVSVRRSRKRKRVINNQRKCRYLLI